VNSLRLSKIDVGECLDWRDDGSIDRSGSSVDLKVMVMKAL